MRAVRSGGFGILRIFWVPFGFKVAVLPRGILFCTLFRIFADKDRGTHSTVITIGFRYPDGLAACIANAVVLHAPPPHIRLEAVNAL